MTDKERSHEGERDKLLDLHEALTDDFLRKAKGEESKLSAQESNAIIKHLQNNGIDVESFRNKELEENQKEKNISELATGA